MELAASSGVAFLGLTHLSKDKDPLGRRIVEKARVVIKMTQPDPEGQPNRRKLWVDKTAAVKPPPLGITMGESGNEYDSRPPSEPEPAMWAGRPRAEGRPPSSSGPRACCSARTNVSAKELEAEWVEAGGNGRTLWRARSRSWRREGMWLTEGGPGKGRQKVVRIVRPAPKTLRTLIS